MSASEEWYYEREARRREIRQRHIAESTRPFLARHRRQLAALREQGLWTYVGEQAAEAEALVDEAESLIGADAERAQELSYRASDLLRGLLSAAKAFRDEENAARAAHRQQERAEKWRARIQAEAAAAAVREEVEEARARVAQVRARATPETSAELEALEKRLASLSEAGTVQGRTPSDVASTLHEVEAAVTEACCDEELRKDTLRALDSTMRNLGFCRASAVLQEGTDRVRIEFRRLQETVVFLVEKTGSMACDFKGYRGAACRKDLDSVCDSLERVYGVHFSKKVVLRENPELLEKDAVNAASSMTK